MDGEYESVGEAISFYCRSYGPHGDNAQNVEPGRVAVMLSSISPTQVVFGRIDRQELMSAAMGLAYDYFEYATAGDAEYDARVVYEPRVVEGADVEELISLAAEALQTLNSRDSVLMDRADAAIHLAACAAAPVVDPDVAAELKARDEAVLAARDNAERASAKGAARADIERGLEECRDLAERSPPSLGGALATVRRLDPATGSAGLGEAHAFGALFFGSDPPYFATRDILWLGREYAAQFAIDYEALLARFVSELADADPKTIRECAAADFRTLTEGEVHKRAAAAARLAAIRIIPQPSSEDDDEDEEPELYQG